MAKNQTSFKKGQIANPKGRPKKVNDIGRYIRMRLGKLPKGKDKRYIYYVVTRMLKKGIQDGDVQAIKELLDRAYGKSKQGIEVAGKVDSKIVVEIKDYGTDKHIGNTSTKTKTSS